MITFKNLDTNQQYPFFDKVNLVMDANLATSLAKENFNNTDSNIVVDGESPIPLKELFQIKVNVKGTGYFLVNFIKGSMDEEKQAEMFDKIKSLKSEDNITDESQKLKIKNLLEILNGYSPLYISFVNNGSPVMTKGEFLTLIDRNTFTSHVFVLMLPFDFIFEARPEKPKHSFFAKKIPSNKPVKVKHTSNSSSDFKMVKKYAYDFLFLALFSLIMGASFLFGLALAFKSDGTAAFLFVISAVFLAVLGYALFSFEKAVKDWKHTFNYIKFPLLSIAVGIALGIGIGFLIAYFVIKSTEENPLNYGFIVGISIPVVIAMATISIFIPEIIRLAKRKSNK